MLDGAVEKLMSALVAGKSEGLKLYLAAIGKFYCYSLGNAMLIVLQCPEATHVAGYRTWKSLGRQVRKGEKGIAIMAPIVRRGDDDKEKDVVVAFRTAHVFDISQTEGQPLPEFARIAGDPSAYFPSLKGFLEARGIELCYSTSTGPAQGLSCGGKIILRQGLEPAEEFATLVHELAHEMLHRRSSGEKETSRSGSVRSGMVLVEEFGLMAQRAEWPTRERVRDWMATDMASEAMCAAFASLSRLVCGKSPSESSYSILRSLSRAIRGSSVCRDFFTCWPCT
jgi:hypothetical protein